MTFKAKFLDQVQARIKELIVPDVGHAMPIRPISKDALMGSALGPVHAAWVEAQGWSADAGAVMLLPSRDGSIEGALCGLGNGGPNGRSPLLMGGLPGKLPAGDWAFAPDAGASGLDALAWLLGAYRYQRYRNGEEGLRRIALPDGIDREPLLRVARAVFFARDLINTPANDFGPPELETAAREVAAAHGASIKVTEGTNLLADDFPMIHAVGRASDREPRLIDLQWGDRAAPKVTLVGKGICFDTGGLNLKPGTSMNLMKKDMGGAASALAVALMVMGAALKLRLRVLIPAADNNVSANAFRPGDVLTSRAGMTVEIGNTDAEGRLVLADALALADEEEPDLIVSLATLTGAARVALGPDLPALYSDDDDLAEDLQAAGREIGDPMWRMPLWRPYDAMLKSRIADVNHISDGSFAGSVTAALFLRRFVKKARRFAHLDIYGWTPRAQPGKPEGGEPQTARALFSYLAREHGA